MYFLENIGFLTEKKYRSHKYLDMRMVDTKRAATNEYLQQPFAFTLCTSIRINLHDLLRHRLLHSKQSFRKVLHRCLRF